MSKMPRLLAFCFAGLVPLAACDSEAPADLDYRAVGHLDLAKLQKAPWIDAAIVGEIADPSGDLGPCADVLRKADAVTFGAGEGTFEIYLRGSIDAAAANACSDHIDDKIRDEKLSDDDVQPEGTMIADNLFAIHSGGLTPTPARRKALLRSQPVKGAPAWVVANGGKGDAPFETVRAWATVGKGVDAHIDATFADDAEANELFGQANLALVALRMSDEAGDLASLIELDSKGRTISAELHADAKQIDAIKALAKSSDEEEASGIELRIGGEAPAGTPKENGVTFTFGSAE